MLFWIISKKMPNGAVIIISIVLLAFGGLASFKIAPLIQMFGGIGVVLGTIDLYRKKKTGIIIGIAIAFWIIGRSLVSFKMRELSILGEAIQTSGSIGIILGVIWGIRNLIIRHFLKSKNS